MQGCFNHAIALAGYQVASTPCQISFYDNLHLLLSVVQGLHRDPLMLLWRPRLDHVLRSVWPLQDSWMVTHRCLRY